MFVGHIEGVGFWGQGHIDDSFGEVDAAFGHTDEMAGLVGGDGDL